MNLDGLSQISARIASIQQRFQPPRGSTATAGSSFADTLASAELMSGGSGGSGGSGPAAQLLSGLSGKLDALGTGVQTGGLSLDSVLASLSGTSGAVSGSGDRTARFLASALEQTGDPYVWGASADPTDSDPEAFDCSELVRWAAGRVGVDLPDGSWLQYLDLQRRGATVSVEEALRTPGALLFSFDREPRPGQGRPGGAHVAISLGDGRTIEARGRRYGVGSWEAGNRFQYAAIIPELNGSSPTALGSGSAAALDRPLQLWNGA